MAGLYPDPPGQRLSVERLNVIYYLQTDSSPAALGSSAKELLADEDYTSLALNPSYGIDPWYLGVIFDDPLTIQGYAVLSQTGGTWDRIEYSTDTVNGVDGTWTLVDASPEGAHNGTSMNYRTDWATPPVAITNAKAFRIRRSGGGNGIYALHLYGHSTNYTNRKLEFWDPDSDSLLSGAAFDFGDVPLESSADRRFRIKNTWTGGEPATNVVVGNYALINPATHPYVVDTFLYSVDGGNTFRGVCYLGDLAPGQISKVIIVRRVTPNWVTTGPWCGMLAVDCIGGDYNPSYTGWYFGDVSTHTPIPHIWYMTPAAQFREQLIEVVGYGFGISEAEFNGECKLGPGAMSIHSWHRDLPKTNAYDTERKIDATVNYSDVFCDRIQAVVPNNAFDDEVTVETDGP